MYIRCYFALSIFVDICTHIFVYITSIFFCICLLVFADGSSCSVPLTSLVGRNSPIRSARDPSNGSKNKKMRQGKKKRKSQLKGMSSIGSGPSISLRFPQSFKLIRTSPFKYLQGRSSSFHYGKPILRFLIVGPSENMSFSASQPPNHLENLSRFYFGRKSQFEVRPCQGT